MKLFIYGVRDKKLGAMPNGPVFRRDDVEHMTELYVRSVRVTEESQRSEVADQALYFLGTFDDVQMKFELLPEVEKLVDAEDYLPKKE